MTAEPLRILVAYKKSRYEQYILDEQDPLVEGLLAAQHESVRSLMVSHEAHQQSLDQIVSHLKQHEVDLSIKYRGDVEDVTGFDLVVAAGGDGTVLDLSHRIKETPILAINTDPGASVGYFSAGTAEEFPHLLAQIREGSLLPVSLRRFRVQIDGEVVGPAVLNDILISHVNPAAVSAYFIKVGGHPAESQRSSGIWISTPAGSTAAIRSAGGLVLPFNSQNLQYLVREPYPPAKGGYRFLKGIQPFEDHLEVVSRMREGKVFLDGPHLVFDLPIGATLTIDSAATPLSIYGLQEERRTA